jgi:DNA-directed RNA polymerase specialized sigma24 family protein
MERLVGRARHRLKAVRLRGVDAEDIALAALHSAFDAISKGRFPRLNDRRDLWQVLITLVDRRFADERRRHFAQRRTPGAAPAEERPPRPDGGEKVRGDMDDLISEDPTPEFAVMFQEELLLRLQQLPKPELREIAVAKMEGWTNEEIAQRLNCVVRTVERRLEMIREIWAAHGVAGDTPG